MPRSLAFVATLLCLLGTTSGFSADRPNVLLIMTDDQGWGDIHSHGNERLSTPTLDRLAAEGAQLEHFFVSPMCGPTRASLLTGRWNLRTGCSWVSHGKEIVRLDETTIGDAFKASGYATGAFGKWHSGEYGPYHPNDRGFDQFVGFCRGAWENYFDAVIEENREPLATKGYITDVLTDAAIEFMGAKRRQPFFCYLPYNAPHHPYQVPLRYWDKYSQLGFDDKTAAVYGMVENIDDNVSRMLGKLDEWGIAENTIVIFTSDNGPTGPTRFNGGMRGKKASVDEGGVRVPMFVRWPGRIKAGSRIHPIAAHVDVFPTLVELCEIEMPKTLPQDGRSLAPLLLGRNVEWPDRMIFAHQNRFGDTLPTPGGLRTQTHRLVNRGDGYELYDMVADPAQTKDIAESNPGLTAKLSKAYETWYADVTSGGIEPPPLPIGYPSGHVVALQAEDSRLSDGLKFHRGKGWAHDSVLNWRSSQDSITWQIDVLQAGRYETTLMYGCLETDIGAKVHLQIGDQSTSAVVKKSHDPVPPERKNKDRNRVATSGPVPTMTWVPLKFDTVTLPEGPTQLTVRVDSKGKAFELKEARLLNVEPKLSHVRPNTVEHPNIALIMADDMDQTVTEKGWIHEENVIVLSPTVDGRVRNALNVPVGRQQEVIESGPDLLEVYRQDNNIPGLRRGPRSSLHSQVCCRARQSHLQH